MNVVCFKALKTEIISFLLNLLEKDGLEFVENIASVKAQIVKALKAMQLNPKYGEQVDNLTLQLQFGRNGFFICAFLQINELLEKSPIWKDYKSQKHDLFLSDRPSAGYLTGDCR